MSPNTAIEFVSMRSLLVLRHAKSSWKDSALDDHERPLNKRGRRDAPRIGKLLVELELVPDVVICSTATRARETVSAVTERAGCRGELVFDDSLYLASPERLVEAIQRHGAPETVRLLVVGHNPSLEELVTRLTGAPQSLPTAALAHIVLPIPSWNELGLETAGRLAGLWRPKELAE